MAPSGPYKLVTVNNAPDRAKRLVGRVVEDVKEQYTIHYVANAESPSLAPPNISSHRASSLTCYSGPEAAKEILEREVPDVVVWRLE